MAADQQLIPVDTLTEFCIRSLRAAGVGEADARTTADCLVTTDTWGVHTHGTKSLRGYVKRLRAGGLRADARPFVASEGPAWAVVDGQSALGMVTSTFAMEAAITRAKVAGIAYVGVRNSCHFGAAGYYASLAARAGLIGLAMANDTPTVAAPGSRGAITGSNPLAYAIPTGDGPPIVFDMAISTVAGGKVYAARATGKPIPDNWIVGPDGLPTTDAALFPNQAALVPMANHKGYGLALLIETLSALLTGAASTWAVNNWMQSDPSLATGHGAAFIAIDIAKMLPIEAFQHRIDSLVREIHHSPCAEGTERIYLPGEMEWEKREKALRTGISLPPDVVESLCGLAQDLNLEAPVQFDRGH